MSRNIKDLKSCRLDFNSNVECHIVAIEMISAYQNKWDCSVRDAIMHLLYDYSELLNNVGTDLKPSVKKAIINQNTKDKDHTIIPDEPSKKIPEETSVIQKNNDLEKNISENNNDIKNIITQDMETESNDKVTKELEEESFSRKNDPWAEIIKKNGL